MFTTKIKIIGAFLLVFGLFGFISLNRHSHAKQNTYHSELWADKAGYNVYLPSLFIYDFDAHRFPVNLDFKTGDGFKLDSLTGKVITKYPYGVSLLQSPFWLLAHIVSTEKTGYSFLYQKSVDIAGSFYLTLGLFFLFFTIKKFKSVLHSLFLSIGIILSTGIFYYGVFETGMSHVYSFSCLSIILYLLFHVNAVNYKKSLLLLGLLSILYVIIRPLNILFLMPTLLCFYFSIEKEIHSYLLNRKFIFVQFLCGILLLLPQLIYYKYAFGSFLTNSYQNEPFIFPTIHRIAILLFSADNGLLIYYPILTGLVFLFIKNRGRFSKMAILFLVLYVLIYASWWSLSLGCGFGHRAINDIFILLFIPVFIHPRKTTPAFLIFLAFFSILNIKFIFSYDTCLFTTDIWNYTEYFSILFGGFK